MHLRTFKRCLFISLAVGLPLSFDASADDETALSYLRSIPAKSAAWPDLSSIGSVKGALDAIGQAIPSLYTGSIEEGDVFEVAPRPSPPSPPAKTDEPAARDESAGTLRRLIRDGYPDRLVGYYFLSLASSNDVEGVGTLIRGLLS